MKKIIALIYLILIIACFANETNANKLEIKNSNEYIIINNEVKFLFKTEKDVTVKLYISDDNKTFHLVKKEENFDYEKDSFKFEDFQNDKLYYYFIEIEKNNEKINSDINTLTKLNINLDVNKPDWAKKSIFYEIFVRSFYDSDGDRIGDFNGIIEKIPYLKELGIDAIWLMPFNKSDTYHGYDVIDYRDVEKDYGTLEDLKNLIKSCKENNIKVIMDLVLNHTSTKHKWFLEAVDNNEKYKNYYVWETKYDVKDDKWYKSRNGEYYYGFYEEKMADLNYRNPKLRSEIKKETKFWIDLGIDGFRLDGSDNIDLDSDVTYGWWQEFSSYVESINPELFIVGENNFPGNYEKIAPFFGVMQSSFNFYLYDKIISMAKGINSDIIDDLRKMHIKYSEYALDYIDSTFMGNHDKARLVSTIKGNSEKPDNIDIAKTKLAYSILFTLTGTPFLYYGDELGQYGGIGQNDINKREPFKWYSDINENGMTTLKKRKMEYITKNTYSYDGISLEEQIDNDESIYNYVKKLIKIRKENSFLFTKLGKRIGTPKNIYGYFVEDEENNDKIYIIHNLSDENTDISLGKQVKNLITDEIYKKKIVSLKPYETIIIKSNDNPFYPYKLENIVLEKSTLKIIFKAPEDTPKDDIIYLPSNINEWGNNSDIEVDTLKKTSDGMYEISITMEEGTNIEFKIVRGTNGIRDWNKDGLDETGARISTNYMYTFSKKDYIFNVEFHGWYDIDLDK